jgi:hypothetical protein
VSADNASDPTIDVVILNYGCIYQGGYVYSIDDTTPDTGSIGGKVAALSDQVPAYPNGVIWSADGSGNYDGGVNLWGIDETSTAGSPSPNASSPAPATQYPGQFNCNGATDGSCDANNSLTYYTAIAASPAPLSHYAAGLCTATLNSYSDWYLPAICEMGYDSTSAGSGCGTAAAPTLQNMQSNLVDNGIAGSPSGYYWSANVASALPTSIAWFQNFTSGGGSTQGFISKGSALGVRCSRALTP